MTDHDDLLARADTAIRGDGVYLARVARVLIDDLRAAGADANQRAERAEAILAAVTALDLRYRSNAFGDQRFRLEARASVADQPATEEPAPEWQYPLHGTCDGCARADVDVRGVDRESQSWICENCDQQEERAVQAAIAVSLTGGSVRSAVDAYNAHHYRHASDPGWPDETRRQPDQEHKENDR